MTLGDIIDKIVTILTGKSGKLRSLEKRFARICEQIKEMEDELYGLRKRIDGPLKRQDSLKAELKTETNPHKQDMIMDDLDRLEKEFGRVIDLARQKGDNLDAALIVRAKIEALIEAARHGGSTVELEDILDQVEDMGKDTADYQALAKKLDKASVGTKSSKKSEKGTQSTSAKDKEDADRAARRARLLGENVGKPASTSTAAPAESATAKEAPKSASEPASSESSAEPPGTTVEG